MRAALALVVLAGFFVLAVALVGGLTALAVWRFSAGDAEGGTWLVVVALAFGGPALWATLRAVFARPEPTGFPLTREDHPGLWRHVDELARLAGTRGPDDIRLVDGANASVWERRGVRYLELGLPLVAGLGVGELRSVLAHELGHYGGGHTQLAAVTFRAKLALELSLRQGHAFGVLSAWAKLYALLAASESRDHERFADEVAVAAAGRDAARRALLRSGPVGEAWSDYLTSYVALALMAGRTPPLLDGFRCYLGHPRRGHELRELETVLAEREPTSVFDSHPPVRERVARMAQVGGGDAPVDERPGWTLLSDIPPEAVAELVGVRGPFATWEELVALSGPAHVRRYADALRHAGRVSKVGGTLADVLAALERGRLHELTGAPVDASLTPEQVRETAVETVTELLACAVADQLVTANRAVLELNWGGMFVLRLPDGAAVHLTDLVGPAVRDPGRVPRVRRDLRAIGVDGV
ncbi:Zn-dependent protease with chaperone function [Lentzea xinjiangensis]|uniref:Zn-dependent protease with chaperone function n=1 Tax=Lentzea xinjiangensis TaxID=402600 RepID=A0A1H9EK06_9PSEU|nr:M48 family metallopeptidase [Lentzea xinjiangensis]SEQ26054.1 Zn-dependent protease with chaperone function [Lentzea xinjiangensis]